MHNFNQTKRAAKAKHRTLGAKETRKGGCGMGCAANLRRPEVFIFNRAVAGAEKYKIEKM